MKRTLLSIALAFAVSTAFAQVEKKENRVRIVTIENGQKKVFEKEFSDDADMEKELKNMEDSVNIKIGKNKVVTVDVRRGKGRIMENDKDVKIFNFRGPEGDKDMFIVAPHAPGMPDMPDMPDAPMAPRGGRKMIKRLEGMHLNLIEDQKSATIKDLHIQPNAPFNGKLNVHFNAPQKGNVTISITDINGKELANEQIKDFQGDYLGQVDIKKNTKGVYFIRVTQGEDGAVRRIKVD